MFEQEWYYPFFSHIVPFLFKHFCLSLHTMSFSSALLNGLPQTVARPIWSGYSSDINLLLGAPLSSGSLSIHLLNIGDQIEVINPSTQDKELATVDEVHGFYARYAVIALNHGTETEDIRLYWIDHRFLVLTPPQKRDASRNWNRRIGFQFRI